MDWNIFWNAFGAIGTTLGTVVAAIAIVSTANEYKRFMKLRCEVVLSICEGSSEGPEWQIVFTNYDVYPLKIKRPSIQIKKNEYLRLPEEVYYNTQFPVTLEARESICINIDKDALFEFIEGHESKKTHKVKISTDNYGSRYTYESVWYKLRRDV